MRRNAALIGALLLLWVGGSVWWYTCKIKGNCGQGNDRQIVSEQLVIELDGEPSKTFRIQNSGNGVMSILPQDGESGLNTIRTFLDDHPGSNIDLVAGSQEGANGLLAMFIISGIEKDRINVFVDETLIEKGRPIKLISRETVVQTKTDTINISEVEAGDSNVWRDPLEDIVITTISEEEDEPEKVRPAVQPSSRPKYKIESALPCPTVQNADLPELGKIYYATSSYRVRCSTQLVEFAALAAQAMELDESLKLEVIGHTDGSDAESDNGQLGLRRAIEVKKFLIRGDVPGHRILTFSRGANEPAGSNSDASGRSQNRRVEIRWN